MNTKDIYARYVAPPHPGEILREDILPHLKIRRCAFAEALGITPRRLGELLAERRSINADLAARLNIVIGFGVQYWLGLQFHYDLWKARNTQIEGVQPRPLQAVLPAPSMQEAQAVAVRPADRESEAEQSDVWNVPAAGGARFGDQDAARTRLPWRLRHGSDEGALR